MYNPLEDETAKTHFYSHRSPQQNPCLRQGALQAVSRGRQETGTSLRPIGVYPPACMPYGQEAAPVGSQ